MPKDKNLSEKLYINFPEISFLGGPDVALG